MNKPGVFIVCLALIALTTGCQNAQTRATEGAVVGGILGAAAGGIIGHQSHHGGEGAAIGAAAGVLTGAIVGAQIPKQGQAAQTPSASRQNQAVQSANPSQMSMQQIIDMTGQGVNENVIIDKIRLSNSNFHLSAEDVNLLKQKGVSQRVIDAMQGK